MTVKTISNSFIQCINDELINVKNTNEFINKQRNNNDREIYNICAVRALFHRNK